jgi:hypothetical protein
LLTFCLALSCVESLSLTSLSNKRPFSSLSSSASVSSSEVTTTGNEDSNTERSSVDHLPMCVSAASSCGLVQLNGRGVNRVQTCQCPHRRSCPLDWDPFSDNTLIHGNDHYKVSFSSFTRLLSYGSYNSFSFAFFPWNPNVFFMLI